MQQYFLAFITGLTTGGLSCLAVQGGLLASSLAHQIEQDMLTAGKKKGKRITNPKTALPIALFLLSKLVAYTILGFLLGLLGSVLTLNSTIRAILLIGIGIFMVGNALRMFNVHPIFRYFAIEPPKFVTRYIRRTAKGKGGSETRPQNDWFTPLFLGALTVLIPCGVTQAMMAVALATGSPLQGAALMFAFILGTSPVFFLVAYLTTQLGARLEKWFMRFVAVVVLVLGLVSVNSGLSLVGSPLALSNLARSFQLARAGTVSQAPVTEAVSQVPSAVLTLTAANNGYFPQTLYAKAGETVTMDIVTNGVSSCSRDFVIPSLGYETLLPATGTVTVSIPAQSSGTVMRFSCSMGMYTGEIVFGE
jgi:sulfite exporter TauE/SafE